jgi:hypothetical protein
VAEVEVEVDLGRSVEEAEQLVTNDARLVEPVDQETRRPLGSPAEWRGDDMDDERTVVGPEMGSHLRTSSLWSTEATARYQCEQAQLGTGAVGYHYRLLGDHLSPPTSSESACER